MSDDAAARIAAWKVLEKRGYVVSDISTGSGVPRGSRLALRDEHGRELLAAVKKSTPRGRISFKKDLANEITVLPEMDLVIHVQPCPDNGEYKITAFDKTTVLGAFRTYQKALTSRGHGHIPLWVNPNPDKPRMAGSGFSEKALWSVSSGSLEEKPLAPLSLSLEEEVVALVAKRTGYHVDRIRVDIHLGK